MNKRIQKRNMTRFDYNIRIISVFVGILFVASLALVVPLANNISANLEKTTNQIKIQTLQNNYSKYLED